MKLVSGQGDNIREHELPDDARAPSVDDEAVLKAREQERAAQEQAYKERAAQAQVRRDKETRIAELKYMLSKTDYQAIKFAEGEMSAGEYAPIKANRSAWRLEINELENEICNMI